MVSIATIITCGITMILCLVLPVLVLVLFARKYRQERIIPAWLLGAAGFFVTQMLIRLPILTVLQTQSWFVTFSQSNLFLYAFSLAFTAGLFELAGRFVVAKLMAKNLTFRRSLAAGLGHGGIEAILLVGTSYITNLAFIFMINSGSFDALVAETAAMGVDAGQLELVKTQLVTYPPAMFLLGGLERILAMICHAAMSIIVCYGVASKKLLPCLLICLGIHTMIDLTAGISMLIGTSLNQTTAYLIIYTILVLTAVASVWTIRKLHSCWLQKEVIL